MTKRRTSHKKSAVKRRKTSATNFQRALMRLKGLKSHHQCQAMKMANDAFIRQMCTHVKKLRYKKLNGKQIKTLKRHRTKLRTLVNPQVSISKKRQLLSQRGGFISMLAPLLLNAVPAAIQGIASIFKR